MYARLVEIAAFWSKSLNPAVIVSSKQKQPILPSRTNKQTKRQPTISSTKQQKHDTRQWQLKK
jgi:hypothetical protein